MRVLLADPDSEFLQIVHSFLWDRGHEAEIAVDGLECISMLREFLPDILVIDQDLLWGGSEGVLEQMDEDLQLSKIPVILTADGKPANKSDATSRTPVACLPKPYRLNELLSHIQHVAAIRSNSSCVD